MNLTERIIKGVSVHDVPVKYLACTSAERRYSAHQTVWKCEVGINRNLVRALVI